MNGFFKNEAYSGSTTFTIKVKVSFVVRYLTLVFYAFEGETLGSPEKKSKFMVSIAIKLIF